MTDEHDETARQKVLDLVKTMDFAMLTTRSQDGESMHSRPMAYRSVEGDGDLWFFSKKSSRKVSELQADPSTVVCFADPRHQNFVTVSGRSEVVEDRDTLKRLWSEIYRTWFPGGPEDPDVIAIRVEAQHAEYWDNPTNPVVYAFGYVKALTTGKASKPGDVGSVDLAG